MKCPNCTCNHRRGKQGMQCRCGYRFVFDPKRHGITDGKFLGHVRRASANGTYFFTENLLYACACRQLKPSLGSLIFSVVAAVVVFSIVPVGKLPTSFQLLLVAALSLFVLLSLRALRPRLSRRRWDKRLKRWLDKGDPRQLARLLRAPQLTLPPPDWDEPDIYDYGVEQILICERDSLVDWLVLNRFHTATKSAVISEGGYPRYLVPKLNQLLTSDDPPAVYLLHDSSSDPQSMSRRVANSTPFELGRTEVIDLGLTPQLVRQIRSLRPVRVSLGSDNVPVDALPLATLTALTTNAYSGRCAFDQLAVGTSEGSMEFNEIVSSDGDGE